MSRFHFLVVDDLPMVRRIVITSLKALGHAQVSEAADGEKALKLLQADNAIGTPINFVVTDLNMPVMGGLELLQTIRATASLQHLPVLMITSEMATDHIMSMMQAGADGYIVKPFLNAAILKQTLCNVLTKRGMV